WRFVKSEERRGDVWVYSDDSIMDMTWEFKPLFDDSEKCYGVIIEQNQQLGMRRLDYTFLYEQNLLKTRIDVLPVGVVQNELSSDLYCVHLFDEESSERYSSLYLEVLDPRNLNSLAYRYLLHRIK
ncbi:MAG: hypothetical protein SNG38_04280, partial [Rikenellaceae bacterium]